MHSPTLLSFIYALYAFVFSGAFLQARATPTPTTPDRRVEFDFERVGTPTMVKRTDPTFPPDPPSCPICQQNYDRISNCAEAAPVLANFTEIIFNPGAFINVIQCACTETFQSVFPQCVDCFVNTNQTQVLDSPDLPSIVSGMRQVCALESTLLGGVASANGELPSTAVVSPTPTPTSNSASSSLRSILAKNGEGIIPKGLYLVMTVAFGAVVGGLVL
ncbi:hypothetical protein K435DRAFT_774907 [Dendrothele bispora CBS 962.96]|uniref:Uncharacterized protein n=1 Tax=Dendrothele bispora (strain CBS 962.96) TaxID=1314807 RepID=A0A4S8MMM7_DENBC|nr:hypothetical protein K435DRAFT_774907 [Dendrothele bispora CBS 962.96]